MIHENKHGTKGDESKGQREIISMMPDTNTEDSLLTIQNCPNVLNPHTAPAVCVTGNGMTISGSSESSIVF